MLVLGLGLWETQWKGRLSGQGCSLLEHFRRHPEASVGK